MSKLGIAFFAVVSLNAATVQAQPVDSATPVVARQVAQDGMALYDRGDCAGAVEKLTKAHALIHVPTLALYAGKCLEKLGRLVDASETYLTATRDEVELGAPAAQKAAQVEADKLRRALLPKIPTVELTVEPAAPELVTIDQQPFPVAMLGLRRPIDPGHHVVEVQRAGKTYESIFDATEGENVEVKIEMTSKRSQAEQTGAGFRVHVRSDVSAVTLLTLDSEKPLCSVPCDKLITGKTRRFRVAGDGVTPSDVFEVQKNDTTIHVQAGSSARRVGGIVAITAGALATIGGAIVIGSAAWCSSTVPHQPECPATMPGQEQLLWSGIVSAAVGLGGIAGGAVLVRQGETTVTLDARGGKPVLRF